MNMDNNTNNNETTRHSFMQTYCKAKTDSTHKNIQKQVGSEEDNKEKQQAISSMNDQNQDTISSSSTLFEQMQTRNVKETILERLDQMEYFVLGLQSKIQKSKDQYYANMIEEEKDHLFDNTSLDPDLRSRIEFLIDLHQARLAHMEQCTKEKLKSILTLINDYDIDDDGDDDDDDDQDGNDAVAVEDNMLHSNTVLIDK